MRPLKLFIFAAVMTMVSCTPQVLPPPIACKSEDAKCFIDAATKTLSVIYSDINYWETVSFWSAVIATLFGVFGTVMIALQTDTNRKWTKPLAIIGTTAVTGITALTTAFHVPENIDKLIDIYSRLNVATNNYGYDMGHKSGIDATDTSRKFTDEFVKLKVELLKVFGTAGRLNNPPAPPAQPAPAPQPTNAPK